MIFPFMHTDMEGQILIDSLIRGGNNMSQADFLAGNTHSGHAKFFPF